MKHDHVFHKLIKFIVFSLAARWIINLEHYAEEFEER